MQYRNLRTRRPPRRLRPRASGAEARRSAPCPASAHLSTRSRRRRLHQRRMAGAGPCLPGPCAGVRRRAPLARPLHTGLGGPRPVPAPVPLHRPCLPSAQRPGGRRPCRLLPTPRRAGAAAGPGAPRRVGAIFSREPRETICPLFIIARQSASRRRFAYMSAPTLSACLWPSASRCLQSGNFGPGLPSHYQPRKPPGGGLGSRAAAGLGRYKAANLTRTLDGRVEQAPAVAPPAAAGPDYGGRGLLPGPWQCNRFRVGRANTHCRIRHRPARAARPR